MTPASKNGSSIASPSTAISEIHAKAGPKVGPRRPKFLGLAASVLGAALCLASSASAGQRISLLGFEGDSATAIRWRVAQILKRAGHVVIGFAPPSRPDSADELRRYAKKRKVDAFVGGSAVEDRDGWELKLSVRGADGASMGRALEFNAPTLGDLVKELKEDGQGQLDRAVQGRSSKRPAKDIDLDSDEEGSADVAGSDGDSWDADAPQPKKGKKSKTKAKKGKRASLERRAKDERRAAPEPLEEDAPTEQRGAKKRRSASSDPLAGAAEINLDEEEPERARTKAKPLPKAKTKSALLAAMWSSADSKKPVSASKKKAAVAREASDSASYDSTSDSRASNTSASDASDSSESYASGSETSGSETSASDEVSDRSETDSSDEPSSDDSSSGESGSGDSSGEVGADEPASESSAAEAGKKLPTAVLGVDAGLVRRDLQYFDDIYGRLRTPSTNAWVYRLHAALWPFARPVKDRIAIVAGYESAFSGQVRDNDIGAEFAVNFSELYGGVRYRHPIGKHEVGVSGTVGVMTAGLDDPDGATGVPEYSYTVLNPTIDLGLDFGSVAVRTALGYRMTLGDFGEVSEVGFFPRMSGYGFDGKLQVEYRYSDEVAFEVAGTLRRYVLEMNSVPQDAFDGESEVAAGAVDQYLGGYFGLNLTL